MKKISLVIIYALILCNLFACGNKISIGGSSYESDLVTSGYYLDKASLSDAAFVDALSKVKAIKKPANLGKVEMPDLSTIELTKQPEIEVTDEMVEAEIEKERDAEVSYVPIKSKREAKMKDKVKIDFKGFQNGVEFDGGAGEDYELVLGSGQFIPGFEEKVAGHFAGKKFNIDVVFPEQYDESLAGKPATFEITIKAIEEPVTPEVNSEFVVKHTKTGSFNVDEYKEEVRNRIKKRNEFMTNQDLMYQFYQKLYDGSKFEPTEQALAWQFSTMIEQYNKQAESSGTNLATMIASSGMSVNDFYAEIKSYVPQAVESAMLFDELKKMYKVNVTENDVKAWFDNLSDAYGYGSQVTYDQYVEYVGLDNLKNTVTEEKVLLKAAEKCKYVEATKTNEE